MSELPRRLVDDIDDDEAARDGRLLLRAARRDMPASTRFDATMARLAATHGIGAARATSLLPRAFSRLRWWAVGPFLAGAVLVGARSSVVGTPSSVAAPETLATSVREERTLATVATERQAEPAPPARTAVSVDMLPDAPAIATPAIPASPDESLHARAATSVAGTKGRRGKAVDVAPSIPSALPSKTADGPDALEAELALVRHARSLVAAKDASGALALLSGYEAKFANGVLTPEVEMIRIQCLEALGRRDEACARATTFLTKYPDTPQTVRVEALLRRLQ